MSVPLPTDSRRTSITTQLASLSAACLWGRKLAPPTGKPLESPCPHPAMFSNLLFQVGEGLTAHLSYPTAIWLKIQKETEDD